MPKITLRRYLHAVRSIWSGLPTILREGPKKTSKPCIDWDLEVDDLLVSHLSVAAGFVLEDPSDIDHSWLGRYLTYRKYVG